MNMITLPAMSAAIEPTDRSMPPEMITKHMPTAMMPMKAVRVSTFIALSSVAKSPLSSGTGDAQQHQADDRADAVQALGPAAAWPARCGGLRVRRSAGRFRWHGR